MTTVEAIDEGILRWYVKSKQQSYVRIWTATQRFVVGYYLFTSAGPVDCPQGEGNNWAEAFAEVPK